eukprot:6176430-Pleurochrysis_carterae.AAC.3
MHARMFTLLCYSFFHAESESAQTVFWAHPGRVHPHSQWLRAFLSGARDGAQPVRRRRRLCQVRGVKYVEL